MDERIDRVGRLKLRKFTNELNFTEDSRMTVETNELQALVDFTYALLEERSSK